MSDSFRPSTDPARTIYDALLEEAEHRDGKDPDVWIYNERMTVLRAARDYALTHDGYRVPHLSEIRRAEHESEGHVDYAAKFARAVARFMES